MKLGVCVPYRNRELHLNEFVPKVSKYLKNQGIDFHMYFGHQVDDKLFNRGAMKNVAAKHAFEDGCDYIVWHDIDMIPVENGGADYTFPKKAPRHIATQISQMDWQLKYHEYFGGAVLFSKEQVEVTNGYSNDYWDWGMEDDDLFWRCHLEGLTDITYSDLPSYKKWFNFNGKDSFIEIPYRNEWRNVFREDHAVEVLVRANQQPEKAAIHLIGDPNGIYVEYPIMRVPGHDYGLSFNNSRAMTMQFWNNFGEHQYMWIKRYDNEWTWIKADFNTEKHTCSFYLNGIEANSKAGHGTPSPLRFPGKLKNYVRKSIFLGYTPTYEDKDPAKYFKGDIADFVLYHKGKEIYRLTEDDSYILHNVKVNEGDMSIHNSIIPFREEGKMRCLPHKDEGFVDGKWAKGETTARNERKYVLQMQQGKYDYKKDGMNSLKYKLVSTEDLTPFATMINVEL